MSQESSLLKLDTTSTEPNHKAIAIWLLACCATIFGMIVLGGVTRLTGLVFPWLNGRRSWAFCHR